ncbi:hypothetical protein EOM86_03545 [Candidatus Nomurabacteria bacterium]|nr:hypothetical protein [Candidatus Nomurabacteria bacterium]
MERHNQDKKWISVLVTDIHLSDDTVDTVVSVMSQAIKLAQNLSIPIILAGDAFTERKSQTLKSLLAFKTILDMAYGNEVHIFGIDGNHDKVDQSVSESYLSPFEHHPALTRVGNHGLEGMSDDGRYFLLDEEAKMLIYGLSHYDDESYAKYLREISADADERGGYTKILISHKGIDGATSNGGEAVRSELTPTRFHAFDRVYMGHYHNRSKLGNKIIYFGSAYQGWFDENDEKGFALLGLDGEIEYIPSEFMKYIEMKIALEGNYIRDIDSAVKMLISEHPDDMKRIKLVGGTAEIRSVDIPRIKQQGILVSTKDTSTGEVLGDVGADDVGFRYVEFNKQTISEAFVDFVDEEMIPEEEVEYAIEVMNKIM